MKGPLDVERNSPRLRSGVDPMIERSLLVRTFMAPIPTAETQLLRSPGGRSVVKGYTEGIPLRMFAPPHVRQTRRALRQLRSDGHFNRPR